MVFLRLDSSINVESISSVMILLTRVYSRIYHIVHVVLKQIWSPVVLQQNLMLAKNIAQVIWRGNGTRNANNCASSAQHEWHAGHSGTLCPAGSLYLYTWTKFLGFERSLRRRLVSGVSKHLAPSGPHHGVQVRLLPVKRSGLLLYV